MITFFMSVPCVETGRSLQESLLRVGTEDVVLASVVRDLGIYIDSVFQ